MGEAPVDGQPIQMLENAAVELDAPVAASNKMDAAKQAVDLTARAGEMEPAAVDAAAPEKAAKKGLFSFGKKKKSVSKLDQMEAAQEAQVQAPTDQQHISNQSAGSADSPVADAPKKAKGGMFKGFGSKKKSSNDLTSSDTVAVRDQNSLNGGDG